MSDSICRWGFLSTAGIGRKNWKGIHLSGNGRVSAVASRSVEKAQAFIDECSAEVPQRGEVAAVGSYEELLSRKDVDAVYVPLPTGIRKEGFKTVGHGPILLIFLRPSMTCPGFAGPGSPCRRRGPWWR